MADFGRMNPQGSSLIRKPGVRPKERQRRNMRSEMDQTRALPYSVRSGEDRTRLSMKLQKPSNGYRRPTQSVGRPAGDQVWILVKKENLSKAQYLYADVVKKGPVPMEVIPSIIVETIVNGWLYRSAVRRSQNIDLLILCFNPLWRTLRAILLLEEWEATRYFCHIGKVWGTVIQIDEDTAKCSRFVVGKVKVSTTTRSVINQEMRLVVGTKPFVIRIAEEQAVFICNSDFRCGCMCHVKEDEQSCTPVLAEEDDDVAGGGDGLHLDNSDDDLRSFITEIIESRGVILEGEESQRDV
ncbi:hypothetical protein Dimus_004150 [Dionaea muscipula]